MYRGLRVDFFFDGIEPGTCQSASLTRCGPEEACFIIHGSAEGICMYKTNI